MARRFNHGIAIDLVNSQMENKAYQKKINDVTSTKVSFTSLGQQIFSFRTDQRSSKLTSTIHFIKIVQHKYTTCPKKSLSLR